MNSYKLGINYQFQSAGYLDLILMVYGLLKEEEQVKASEHLKQITFQVSSQVILLKHEACHA